MMERDISMDKISIIVPVYKVEKYLRRCVNSILLQTYDNFEVILVDDGSPDTCGEICDEFAMQDNRVVVLHRKNGGLSVARNTALDWVFANSTSQYITFIDSDDWVHPQYLELMLDAIKKYNVGISVCDFQRTDELYSQKNKLIEDYDSVKLDAESLLIDYVWNFNYAWGKLYNRKYFYNVRYPEGKNFEDIFTTYKVLFSAKMNVFVNQPLYFYFKNEEGITRSPWTPKELVVFEAMKKQMDFYQKNSYIRALEKEQYLYVNHFAYQICRIRENKIDLKYNKKYIFKLRKEMMKLVHQYPEKYGYRKMPQCYEAAFPRIMNVYHRLGKIYHKIIKSGR